MPTSGFIKMQFKLRCRIKIALTGEKKNEAGAMAHASACMQRCDARCKGFGVQGVGSPGVWCPGGRKSRGFGAQGFWWSGGLGSRGFGVHGVWGPGGLVPNGSEVQRVWFPGFLVVRGFGVPGVWCPGGLVVRGFCVKRVWCQGGLGSKGSEWSSPAGVMQRTGRVNQSR